MPGMTNRGKFNTLAWVFQNVAEDVNFFAALSTNATPPTPDTNTLADLTQIVTGNGYADGGVSVARDATDFDVLTEDDGTDRAFIQLKDIVYTASGGPIPLSGSGARWFLLLGANATPSLREVWMYWNLVVDRSINDTETLTIQDAELRLDDS